MYYNLCVCVDHETISAFFQTPSEIIQALCTQAVCSSHISRPHTDCTQSQDKILKPSAVPVYLYTVAVCSQLHCTQCTLRFEQHVFIYMLCIAPLCMLTRNAQDFVWSPSKLYRNSWLDPAIVAGVPPLYEGGLVSFAST